MIRIVFTLTVVVVVIGGLRSSPSVASTPSTITGPVARRQRQPRRIPDPLQSRSPRIGRHMIQLTSHIPDRLAPHRNQHSLRHASTTDSPDSETDWLQ